MERKKLEEQFEAYKKLIEGNLEAVKALSEQADLLTDMLTNMVDSLAEDADKQKVIGAPEAIYQSINDLLGNTDQLFDKYKDLIDDYAQVA
ncbi:MAG: hypothetical protein ACR2PW_02640 [Gammaproteobacteria bacterium]